MRARKMYTTFILTLFKINGRQIELNDYMILLSVGNALIFIIAFLRHLIYSENPTVPNNCFEYVPSSERWE